MRRTFRRMQYAGELFPEALDPAKMRDMFPGEQLARWPRGYRPCQGVSYYLFPKGIPLSELIEGRASIRCDEHNQLQRDFSSDNNLWIRCQFEDLILHSSESQRRSMKKVLSRHRLPAEADVLQAFRMKPRPSKYSFASFARLQDVAMAPLSNCTAMSDRVRFMDFPSIRNVLHMHYDSMTALRFVAAKTREEIFYTKEFVQELAFFLRARYDELEPKLKGRPILTMFGNGRLAHELNDTGLFPVRVIAINPPTPYTMRKHKLPDVIDTPRSFHHEFLVDTMSIDDALAKYEPSMVIGEPHSERDYTAEMRGYYTVREVYLIGQVDSPAMCSFTYPWLSFGVGPSIDTYWMFNEMLRKMVLPTRPGQRPGAGSFMPTDPPHVLQGYTKEYVDSVSRYLIGSNDTDQHPYQYRVVRFSRKEEPKRCNAPSTESSVPPTTTETP